MKRNEKNSKDEKIKSRFDEWRDDWNLFIKDVFGVTLDSEQQEIVTSVQNNRRVSVRSGTARGKDFLAACCALCFLYLTPRWDAKGRMVENTKVALTAPTDRQVKNIMMPEIARLYNNAKRRGVTLPGQLNAYDIRTKNAEWFLTGFKADEHDHEAWSGFHAVHTMFVITEATGITDDTFAAIEGNLQGDSRALLVFNPNTTVGYAAKSQKSARWKKFRLNSLTAPNVVGKKVVIPGQVDYEWVVDKVENWCDKITPDEVKKSENDFKFEGKWYRPSDLFRKKVLGEFPLADDDILIPGAWIEQAQERWKENMLTSWNDGIWGVDVAGMGRDSTVFCPRYGNYVPYIQKHNSGGKADHMRTAGKIINIIRTYSGCTVPIDTIGEGAAVFSRAQEVCSMEGLNINAVISCKYSNGAKRGKTPLTDVTGQYKFANMRAYLFWAVRDWLNPDNGNNAMLPPDCGIAEDASEIRWSFLSNGNIIIEPKEDIKKRLGHSPDEFDALANTFFPDAVECLGYREKDGMDDEDIESLIY